MMGLRSACQHGLFIQNLDHKLNLLMGLRSAYQHDLLIQNLGHKFNLLKKKIYLGSKSGDREQRWYLWTKAGAKSSTMASSYASTVTSMLATDRENQRARGTRWIWEEEQENCSRARGTRWIWEEEQENCSSSLWFSRSVANIWYQI
jgi:hypothetical protein